MATIKDLKHVTRDLPGGGRVVVLNTGALIGPEADAMLQALYSRSVEKVEDNLTVLAEKGPEKFMATYYVGYGHKSIGDCGSATIFIERVSMPVAKAVQDNRLYSGQESSTRYLDFSKQPFVDPLGNSEGARIQENWRHFYLEGLNQVVSALALRYPRQEGEKESVWEKAIRARAFDIMRAFLPAGAATNVSWHSNLRQFADKLDLLRHHPLAEVRTVAEAIEDALKEAAPSSFSSKRYQDKEDYNSWWMPEYGYSDWECPEFGLSRCDIHSSDLKTFERLLSKRPAKTELPAFLGDLGMVRYEFLLDFGSYRDIQRHRGVYQRMPLLSTRHGFHPWYLSELPADLQTRALGFISSSKERLEKLGAGSKEAQYYLPMGYRIPNMVTGGLPSLVYLAELRASRFVHPTLAQKAGLIARSLEEQFGPHGLVLHLDKEPSRFDIRRGEHDITVR
ncbi:MAG TPA: FAD-dependent thymidylate synthase [Candidatus Paceibacterota bacterium]